MKEHGYVWGTTGRSSFTQDTWQQQKLRGVKYLAIHVREPARRRATYLANTPAFANAQRARKKSGGPVRGTQEPDRTAPPALTEDEVWEQFFPTAAAQNIKRLVRFLSQAPEPRSL